MGFFADLIGAIVGAGVTFLLGQTAKCALKGLVISYSLSVKASLPSSPLES